MNRMVPRGIVSETLVLFSGEILISLPEVSLLTQLLVYHLLRLTFPADNILRKTGVGFFNPQQVISCNITLTLDCLAINPIFLCPEIFQKTDMRFWYPAPPGSVPRSRSDPSARLLQVLQEPARGSVVRGTATTPAGSASRALLPREQVPS